MNLRIDRLGASDDKLIRSSQREMLNMAAVRYWLSHDCFVCSVGGRSICLNSRRRRYFEFAADISNALARCVVGWPHVDGSQDLRPHSQESSSLDELISDLLRQGILVVERRRGKQATPVVVPMPSTALLDEYESFEAKINISDLLFFLRASLSAAWMVGMHRKERLFAELLRRSRRRKTQTMRGRTVIPNEADDAKRTVAVFRKLRPFLCKSEEQEYIERLVLLKFLEYRGYCVRWIFGVSVEPFGLHTWLQSESTVIDDSPRFVTCYVPIVAL